MDHRLGPWSRYRVYSDITGHYVEYKLIFRQMQCSALTLKLHSVISPMFVHSYFKPCAISGLMSLLENVRQVFFFLINIGIFSGLHHYITRREVVAAAALLETSNVY